ncbi:hypothetical protein K439DRAFT_856564 [Ramaria rubella]|nr:hypothetical protein K439DRAFT_856564 [Ramaria rubella]
MTREFANHVPSYAAHSLATFKWRMKDRPKTPSNRGHTGNEPEGREAGGSVQDENMDEVPSLCEDEDENEDFTRQELDAWSEARDCYEHEAAVARAQLGGKPSSFDVIKVLFPEVEQPLSTVSPSMKAK